MQTKIIEATDSTNFNWGKFMVCRFSPDEWARRSEMPGCESQRSLLSQIGWNTSNIIVLDLQTGEGAIFRPGGYAPADLNKHRVWVCPMYEPFLTWLYKQDLTDIQKLPGCVDLGNVPTAMAGYRRPGPEGK